MSEPVEKYAADIIMADWGLLGAGGHPQGPEETVDQYRQLVDIFCFCLHHVEDYLVPLPHALSMRGADIVLDDDLPLSSAKPSTQKTLNLQR